MSTQENHLNHCNILTTSQISGTKQPAYSYQSAAAPKPYVGFLDSFGLPGMTAARIFLRSALFMPKNRL